jgi:transcriptional regulator with XRE-family HTH domain
MNNEQDELPPVVAAEASAAAERLPGALERYVGNTIRDLRRAHGLTIADIAEKAEISRGMLSRIENGQTASSLEGLNRIARALGVSLSTLFRNFEVDGGGAQLVKNGQGMEVARRGTRSGHTYHLLAYDQGPSKLFEPFLISIDEPSETFPVFEHPGTEFIYMLQGRMEYRHGASSYRLEPGDALTFNGEVPHGPGELTECPIRFITVIIYPTGARE